MSALTFANNDGWHDDLCDGPVRATVTFAGQAPIEAEPGYVSVTPPNYAPGTFGLVTMDDVVREVFYDKRWLPTPDKTSFADDVLPIFQRLTVLQWVNHGLFVLHGSGSTLDTGNPQVVTKLGDNAAANAGWRKRVLALFRDPSARIWSRIKSCKPMAMPSMIISGRRRRHRTDCWLLPKPNMPISRAGPTAISPPAHRSLPQTFPHSRRHSRCSISSAPRCTIALAARYPAMELTWVMRIPLLWKSAYRLNVLPGDNAARQNFGGELTPAVCIGAGGPYDGAAAGCLTRFLGVPWHTDHTSCNSAGDYFPSSFLSMPTFWGPRAPDQVLPVGNYLRAAAISGPGAQTQVQTFKYLMQRADWLRDVRGFDYYDRLSLMIKEWAELGMVLPVEGMPIRCRCRICASNRDAMTGAS